MLLAITPNPCLERIVPLPRLAPGEAVRAESARVREVAGGKALNAARVARSCGTDAIVTGWFGRDRAAWFASQLEASGVEFAPVEVDSPTRIATQLREEEEGGRVSEVIENGHALSLEDGTRLLQKVEELLPQASLALIGGSYPPSPDPRFVGHASLLCASAKRHAVPVLYDGSGSAWEIALRKSPPWCVAPNIEEASALLRRPLKNEAAERRAIETILKWGVSVVLLTCGERGAYLGTREQTVFLASPRVEARTRVGCGDALVGAFASKYLQSANEANAFTRLREALRYGIAAGAAQAQSEVTAQVAREQVEALVPQVRVQQHLLSLSPR